MRIITKIAVAISFSMMSFAVYGTGTAISANASIEEKTPYVANNDVHLAYGDSFGLKLTVENGEISTVTQQKDKTGADVAVEFKQEDNSNGKTMTMLILKSNIKQVLYMDALMTVPDSKGVYETSILPLQPGLMGFETWPHPIVQLVLRNIRLKK